MIAGANDDFAYSSLGWVDGGSVWVCELSTTIIAAIELSDAEYLSLHDGVNGLIAVKHSWQERGRLRVSIHRKDKSLTQVATFDYENGRELFQGDLSAWSGVPSAYIAYIERGLTANYHLLRLSPRIGKVEYHPLEWFDDSYDHGYQGVIGVVQVPNTNLVIVSVQRDSSPVLFDPDSNRVLRKISLAGRLGNPTLVFDSSNQFLWADDYDTLLKIDAENWQVVESRRLQDPDGDMNQFIGSYYLNEPENLCIVARPYSGDVVAVSNGDLKIKGSCSLPGQPLEAVTYRKRRVIARDWQSGEILTGEMAMARKFFFFA